ncbi:MAG TPA: ATP-binding protein [candidate division Zixibacteria bacterium]|nr:ATP-binding protein [candidate division Zixibacteria bacterium]
MEKKLTKILLVEDNPADAVLIKEYINGSKSGEIELQWVDRMAPALQLLEETKIEAVLLDLSLPDSNGLPTFEKLYKRFPQIPIIILTGFSDSTLASRAVRSGAQDYLVKGLVDSHSLNRSINYAIERKRAQEALQESQRTLETLMKNLPGMAYRCSNDRQWTMKFVSEGCIKLTGYQQADLIDNKVLSYNSLIHKEDRERVWQESQKALDMRIPSRLIYRIYTKENQLKWVWEQGRGVFDEKGKFLALEGFIIDITEQTEYQNKLRKLSGALSQASSMICITDTGGIIEYVNPAFIKGIGFGFKEVYGEELRSIKVVVDNEEYYRNVWKKIIAGDSWTDKVQCLKRTGEWYWEQLNVSPIFDDNAKVINAIFVGTDITSEILTQQKLVEADKMSAIGLLAAGVAHEFKNFLGGIIGYASYAQSTLETEDSSKEVKDSLKHIVEIGERANEVAMSLLTYSKVKTHVLTKQELKSSIEKTLELFSKELKNSCIQVETRFDDVPMIRLSSGRIQQVLLNLLINARDAIEKHGNIKITLYTEENWVRVKVADNGAGIAKENLSKIFDPFYSTKGVWGKDEVVGTGMGLSVSRNIAREHGGDLTVESEVGKGSTFTLSLPITDEENDSHEPEFQWENIAADCKNLVLLTLDETIRTKYQEEAAKLSCNLSTFDSAESLKKNLGKIFNVAVADAHFPAKVELYQMLDECRKNSLPFLMINCGAMEYQLNELYENALAVYRDCPDLKQIIMQIRSAHILQNQKSPVTK